MNKQIYLVRGIENETYSDFRARIMDFTEDISRNVRISGISFVITEEKPPLLSVIPFRKDKIASISVNSENSLVSRFKELSGLSGAFFVHQDLPVAYNHDWKGDKTPGVCLLTLFRQRSGLDRDEFIDRWHNGHTPLSLRIHPLWHYARNVVDEVLWEGSEYFDGIVEEHTRTRKDLLDPFRFFGSPVSIVPNMLKVYFDVKGFLDYPSIEPYLTREYILK